MGRVYKEQKELDPLPAVSNPSILTIKSSKPISRKEKKLIVLHNFTNLEVCGFIMREMKDVSIDIIIVSNELFCKEEIAKDFDKYFSRGCNIIEVTNLQHISIIQRIVYGLLEKNSFVVRDADHIVFTLLSEYSRGAATVVHLLTSLMQKDDGNNRTGFELAKHQLKLYIAHQEVEMFLDSHSTPNILSKAKSMKKQDRDGNPMTREKSSVTCVSDDTRSIDDMKIQDHGNNATTEEETQMAHASDSISRSMTCHDQPGEKFLSEVAPFCTDDKNQTTISESQSYVKVSPSISQPTTSTSTQLQIKDTEDTTPTISDTNSTSGYVSMHNQNETCDMTPSKLKAGLQVVIIPEAYSSTSETGSDKSVTSTSQPVTTEVITKGMSDKPALTSKISRTGNEDTKQTVRSYATQPSTTAKLGKLTATPKHPLYMYINDLLSTTINVSLPAHHLLNCLVITGSIPLPLFYVEELNNIVMNAVISKEKKKLQELHGFVSESPIEQLAKEGVIRKYP